MTISDIHTHRYPECPGQAIINCDPHEFAPREGHYYSVGFHPWYLGSTGNEDWNLLATVGRHRQVLALGETGLDKIKGPAFDVQERAFEKHVCIALLLQKPLIIHCVKSYHEILRYKKMFRPDNPWVIHGFRGRKELAQQLVDNGIYLSFGEKYQEEALQATPLSKLFLETDSDTMDIRTLYEKTAGVLSIPTERLAGQIQQNIRNVFG